MADSTIQRQQPAPGGQVLNEVAAAAAAPLLPPLGAKIQEHDRAAAAPCLACCVQLRQQTYRRELQVQLIAAPRLALASSTAWQPTLLAHMRRRPRTWPQRDPVRKLADILILSSAPACTLTGAGRPLAFASLPSTQRPCPVSRLVYHVPNRYHTETRESLTGVGKPAEHSKHSDKQAQAGVFTEGAGAGRVGCAVLDRGNTD